MNSLERIIFVEFMNNNSRQRSICYNVVLMGTMCAVYLLFSVGIVKATHFCMGTEASVSFFTTEAEKCACGLSGLEQTCCADERGLLKLHDSQKNLSIFQMDVPVFDLLGELYTRCFKAGREVSRAARDASDPPPFQTNLYKLYCKYVFYDD